MFPFPDLAQTYLHARPSAETGKIGQSILQSGFLSDGKPGTAIQKLGDSGR